MQVISVIFHHLFDGRSYRAQPSATAVVIIEVYIMPVIRRNIYDDTEAALAVRTDEIFCIFIAI